ncbi:MAG: Ribonuclease PH [candidate division BRC1 bacterium ADurb.BinA364]|nr:MAG: Ribonuclease PH [candidate division BRC1 bacterium ADurb.BinA364]
MRVDGRAADELRPIAITPNWLKTAQGSAMVEFGDTKVLCAATVDNSAPPHRRDTGMGWLTAEYAMLPCCSKIRIPRDSIKGRVSGRSQEIQRLIGRCLRAVFDMNAFGERTILVDCDVIQADGGTRTASITGAFVAVALAMRGLVEARQAKGLLLRDFLGAVSVGLVEGRPALDLRYIEDAQAEMDMNVVMTGSGDIVEVQATAEATPVSRAQFDELLELAAGGIQRIVAAQREALGIDSL